MRINGINILIFPEYHLTDFPPQALLSRQEAYEMLLPYKRFGFDVLISGYIEKAHNEKFSSCLVIDDKEVHNVRKKYPYKDEINIISPSTDENKPIALSIGLSLFIRCHDFSFLLDGEYQDTIDQGRIDNLILISAMFHKFQENTNRCLKFCKALGIKRFITSDRFFGLKQTEIA